MAAENEFKIERGIAVPNIKRGERDKKYPFESMDVDTSFFSPDVKATAMQTAVSRYIKTDSGRYKILVCRSTIEKVDGVDTKGVRVFRTK